MDYENYYIPANFTDAGRILGIFEIRNVVEALILGVPIVFLCAYLLPLGLMAKIIVTLVIFIPIAGFALIGISDESLSRYISARMKWHRGKRVLTFKGEMDYHGFEKSYIRSACGR